VIDPINAGIDLGTIISVTGKSQVIELNYPEIAAGNFSY
jgi:hypothetical protein